jgi:hypothetical protein
MLLMSYFFVTIHKTFCYCHYSAQISVLLEAKINVIRFKKAQGRIKALVGPTHFLFFCGCIAFNLTLVGPYTPILGFRRPLFLHFGFRGPLLLQRL